MEQSHGHDTRRTCKAAQLNAAQIVASIDGTRYDSGNSSKST
jgi:hypothetical protein